MPVVCHRPARSNLTVITRYFSLNSPGNTVIQTETKRKYTGGISLSLPSLCYGVSINVAYAHHDNNRNVPDKCI